MKKINLGNEGLAVPIIGFIATIHRSLELGGNFLDTADLYGPFKNEQLLARAIDGNRNKSCTTPWTSS